MKVKVGGRSLEIDGEVVEYIKRGNGDYRLSTDCFGPILLSVEEKSPKKSDYKVRVGDKILYISTFVFHSIESIEKMVLPQLRWPYYTCKL